MLGTDLKYENTWIFATFLILSNAYFKISMGMVFLMQKLPIYATTILILKPILDNIRNVAKVYQYQILTLWIEWSSSTFLEYF